MLPAFYMTYNCPAEFGPAGSTPLEYPTGRPLGLGPGHGASSLATTIAMEMVVPILLGYGLDYWLGTRPVFTIVGAALGMAGGLWHLIRLAGELSGKSEKGRDRKEDQPPP